MIPSIESNLECKERARTKIIAMKQYKQFFNWICKKKKKKNKFPTRDPKLSTTAKPLTVSSNIFRSFRSLFNRDFNLFPFFAISYEKEKRKRKRERKKKDTHFVSFFFLFLFQRRIKGANVPVEGNIPIENTGGKIRRCTPMGRKDGL